ncbi:hypothetical protein MHYP_G00022720 [Metynnis hypsauchen]
MNEGSDREGRRNGVEQGKTAERYSGPARWMKVQFTWQSSSSSGHTLNFLKGSVSEESSLTIPLWGVLAESAEPLRCQAGSACCQIRPCWLTSASPPRTPLPGSPELLSHFPTLPPAHWHQCHTAAPSPCDCCHGVLTSHWHRAGVCRVTRLFVVCNITGSLQNPRQSHFQPLAPENLAPVLFERVDCVIFTMSLPEHFT